jgi:hypothetical protein
LESFETRHWLAIGLIASVTIGAISAFLVQRRKAYWRKLRMSGNGEAKRRELRGRR